MNHIYATYNDAPTDGMFRIRDAEHTRPYYAACPAWRFCRPSSVERADVPTFTVTAGLWNG
jgi:hypothetical protein